MAELKKRGLTFGKQRKDEYVNQLLLHEPKGISSEERLLHKLVICALIEARSCERFRLLSLHIEEEQLRNFYHKFMVSEAGHYRLFLDLAKLYFDEDRVRQTWLDWLAIEKKILEQMPPRGDRMH